LVIVGAFLLSMLFNLNLTQNLVFGWFLTTLFAIFAFFVVDHSTIMQPERTLVREVERPVIMEIERPVQVPVEKEVVRIVEKPVYIEKKVKVKVRERKKKLNIPKYKYHGSTETKTYHLRNCRFGKLIKRKYNLPSNSLKVFKKKRFKACKICMQKKKKSIQKKKQAKKKKV